MPTFDERGLPSNYPLMPEAEISPAALAAQIKANPARVILIDVRTPPEVAFASIPGLPSASTISIPLDDLPARAASLDLPEDATVAVLCHHGRRSLTAAAILHEAGIPHARSIAGGLDIWSQSIDPAVPRYRRDGLRVWAL